MLTRLEVDGFKNLLDVDVSFGPFTCIAGENGVGKSNVFDAIELLSLLSDNTLMDAAQLLRSTKDDRSGDPKDLFWNLGRDGDGHIRIAAELVVPRTNDDDFGRTATAAITFLRYEVEIGYESPRGPERLGRLVLRAERLTHINRGDAAKHLSFPHSRAFRDQVVSGRRSGGPFISTDIEDGEAVINIHQDGGSRGRPRKALASRAPSTVVGTSTTSDDPTILAVRRELQSWRRLALEPSALRAVDRYVDPRSMTPDGRHLPAVLHRIAGADEYGRSQVFARVASRLSSLTGVDVRDLTVDVDDTRELLSIKVVTAGGTELPARSLSEGTLRFLALCVLLEDTDAGGLVCMEEPENGIHPANAPLMVDLVEDLAVDANQETGEDNPLRQVIINTHSPAVVQLVGDQNLLFATPTSRQAHSAGGKGMQLRPMAGSWRAAGTRVPLLTKADILPYLTEPPGRQLSLQTPTSES